MRPFRLTYTKLDTFEKCRLRYRWQYMEKNRQKGAPMTALVFEQRLHKALERYHKTQAKDGHVEVKGLLDQWERVWTEGKVENFPSLSTYREGVTLLTRYAQRENKAHRVPAELEMEVTLAFGPYNLYGKIDRLDFIENDNRYSLVDYKLHRQVPEGNSAAGNRQLAFYALLCEQGPGLPVREVSLDYLRHGIRHTHALDKETFFQTRDWMDATVAAIQAERHWEPVEGAHCNTCRFRAQCPAKTGEEIALQGVVRQRTIYDDFEEGS